MYEIKWVRGEHIEVFINGKFQFSADSMREVHEAFEEEGGETPCIP